MTAKYPDLLPVVIETPHHHTKRSRGHTMIINTDHLCSCGHTAGDHEHLRAGTDCGLCRCVVFKGTQA